MVFGSDKRLRETFRRRWGWEIRSMLRCLCSHESARPARGRRHQEQQAEQDDGRERQGKEKSAQPGKGEEFASARRPQSLGMQRFHRSQSSTCHRGWTLAMEVISRIWWDWTD